MRSFMLSFSFWLRKYYVVLKRVIEHVHSRVAGSHSLGFHVREFKGTVVTGGIRESGRQGALPRSSICEYFHTVFGEQGSSQTHLGSDPHSATY